MAAAIEIEAENSVKRSFKDFNLDNPYSVISLARKGLKPNIFYHLARVIKMPEGKLARIVNLSARTITNYKKENKVFAPVHSEHILKLIALFEKGENLFGNIDEFNYWLGKPFWNGNETPFDWIVTPGGVDLLMQELDKLAQGYPI